MALLLVDSFSSYLHLAHSPDYWNIYYPAVREDGIGRHGSGGVRFESYDWNAGMYIRPSGMDASTIIVGFNIIRNHASNSWCMRFRNMDGGDGTDRNLVQLWFYQDRIEVFNAINTTLLATYNIDLSSWKYIEAKVSFHETLGAFELRAEGVTLQSTTGTSQYTNVNTVDPNEVTRNTIDNIYVYPNTPYSSTDDMCVISDLYVADLTGTVNNDFIGPLKIDFKQPVASGAASDYALPPAVEVADPLTPHHTMVNNPIVKSTVQHSLRVEQPETLDSYYYNRNSATVVSGALRLWCYDYGGYSLVRLEPIRIPRTAKIISAVFSYTKYSCPWNYGNDSSYDVSLRFSFMNNGVVWPPTTDSQVWNIASNYYYHSDTDSLWSSTDHVTYTVDVSRFLRQRLQYSQWNEAGEQVCVGFRTHNCPSNYSGSSDYTELYSRRVVGKSNDYLPRIDIVWEEGEPVTSDSYLTTDTAAQEELFEYDFSDITDPILGIKHSALGRSDLNQDRTIKQKVISNSLTAESTAQTHSLERSSASAGIFEKDPNTGLLWTPAGATAADFGVETE